MRFNTIILLTALCLSHAAGADVIRVPDDYASIQVAIDSASHGDTVLVDPGTYIENIDYHGKQLVVGSLFLTTGNEDYISQTIIDGNRDSSVVSIQDFEPEGTELVGFSITNGLGTGDWPNVRGGGIHVALVAKPHIRYCYIYDNESVGASNRGGGIYLVSDDVRISNCKIYNNTADLGAGITVGNGSDNTIIDSCEVFNNDRSGVVVGYSFGITMRRTLIYNNQLSGFRSFATNPTHMIHCTIVDNRGAGLVHSASGDNDTLYVSNSIVYGNDLPVDIEDDTLVFVRYSIIEDGDGRLWFGEGSTSQAPVFESESWIPAENSPAVDGGDPLSLLDPDNTRADIGAIYRNQETTSVFEPFIQPAGFDLFNNYPNPFNPGTTIGYSLDRPSQVDLKIYDALGRFVKTLASGIKSPGEHKISWDGRDSLGRQVSSGIYYYRIRTQGSELTRQMLLVR